MDGMARLVDGCQQVLDATWYQDILVTMMLQIRAAITLPPSGLSKIQANDELCEWAASLKASPRTALI